MPHLLVPTDFSTGAANALEYAAKLAEKWKAPIRLFYAFPTPFDFAAQMQERIDHIRRQARRQLKEEIAALQANPALAGIPIDYKIVEGQQERCLQKEARELPNAWVIMGHRHRDWFHELSIGDAAVEFARHSPVPVLVVPEQLPYHRPSELVFATRFAENEAEDIAASVFLAESFKAKLILAHIAENDGHEEELRFRGFREEVKKSVAYKKVEVVMFTSPKVRIGLAEALQLNKHSWLILSHQHQSFFKRLLVPSITKELLENASWPSLVFTHPAT